MPSSVRFSFYYSIYINLRCSKIKTKMIMVIIKLFFLMYTPFTHTETTHPGCFWGAVVGGPHSAVEVWTPQEASELACLSCLYMTAPLPQGGVWVCGVKLVGGSEMRLVISSSRSKSLVSGGWMKVKESHKLSSFSHTDNKTDRMCVWV